MASTAKEEELLRLQLSELAVSWLHASQGPSASTEGGSTSLLACNTKSISGAGGRGLQRPQPACLQALLPALCISLINCPEASHAGFLTCLALHFSWHLSERKRALSYRRNSMKEEWRGNTLRAGRAHAYSQPTESRCYSGRRLRALIYLASLKENARRLGGLKTCRLEIKEGGYGVLYFDYWNHSTCLKAAGPPPLRKRKLTASSLRTSAPPPTKGQPL